MIASRVRSYSMRKLQITERGRAQNAITVGCMATAVIICNVLRSIVVYKYQLNERTKNVLQQLDKELFASQALSWTGDQRSNSLYLASFRLTKNRLFWFAGLRQSASYFRMIRIPMNTNDPRGTAVTFAFLLGRCSSWKCRFWMQWHTRMECLDWGADRFDS